MGWLTVLNILGSVQEPQGDLELLGIGNNGDDLRDFLLSELTRSLGQVDVTLLADDVGESSTDTLKLRNAKT